MYYINLRHVMLFNDWLIVYELLWLVLSRGWFVFIIGMRLLLCLVTPAFSRASVCNWSAIHLDSYHRHARKYHADDVILFSRELLTPPKGTFLQLEFGIDVQEALRGMLILSNVLSINCSASFTIVSKMSLSTRQTARPY